MTFHSGIDGKAFIGVAELPITGWSVNPQSTKQEFKNSKTGKFARKEATYRDLTGSITIDFDFDDNPFDLATPIEDGAIITGVKLYLNGVAGVYWDLPSVLIEGTPQSLEVDGKIQTTFNFSNDGDYGTPGNPVTP